MAIHKHPSFLEDQLRLKLSQSESLKKPDDLPYVPKYTHISKKYLDFASQLARRDVQEKNFHFFNVVKNDDKLKQLLSKRHTLRIYDEEEDEDEDGLGNREYDVDVRNKYIENIKKLPARSMSPPTRDVNAHPYNLLQKKRLPINETKLTSETDRLMEEMDRSIRRIVVLAGVKIPNKNIADDEDSLEVMKRKVRITERSTRISRSLYEVDRESKKVMMMMTAMTGGDDSRVQNHWSTLNQLVASLRGLSKVLTMVVQQMSDMPDPHRFLQSKIFRDVYGVVERVVLISRKLNASLGLSFNLYSDWLVNLKAIMHPVEAGNLKVDLNNNVIEPTMTTTTTTTIYPQSATMLSTIKPTTTTMAATNATMKKGGLNVENMKSILQRKQQHLKSQQDEIRQQISQQKRKERHQLLQQKPILKSYENEGNNFVEKDQSSDGEMLIKKSTLSKWLKVLLDSEAMDGKENVEKNLQQKSRTSTKLPQRQSSLLQRFLKSCHNSRIRKKQFKIDGNLKQMATTTTTTPPTNRRVEKYRQHFCYHCGNLIRSISSPPKLTIKRTTQTQIDDANIGENVGKHLLNGNERFSTQSPMFLNNVDVDANNDTNFMYNRTNLNKYPLRPKSLPYRSKQQLDDAENCMHHHHHHHNRRCYGCNKNQQQQQQQQQIIHGTQQMKGKFQRQLQQKIRRQQILNKYSTNKKWFQPEDIILINDDDDKDDDGGHDDDPGVDGVNEELNEMKEKLRRFDFERQNIKQRWTNATKTSSKTHPNMETETETQSNIPVTKSNNSTKDGDDNNNNDDNDDDNNSNNNNDKRGMENLESRWEKVDKDFFKYVNFDDINIDGIDDVDKLKIIDVINGADGVTVGQKNSTPVIFGDGGGGGDLFQGAINRLHKIPNVDKNTPPPIESEIDRMTSDKNKTSSIVNNHHHRRYHHDPRHSIYGKPIQLNLEEATHCNILNQKRRSDKQARSRKVKIRFNTTVDDGEVGNGDGCGASRGDINAGSRGGGGVKNSDDNIRLADGDIGVGGVEESVDEDVLCEYLTDKLVSRCLHDVCREMERINDRVVDTVYRSEFNDD